jgi:hypothetical protein
MHIEILRDRIEPEGVFGKMFVDGELFCATCEQPWRDNKPYISCIPAGEYNLVPWDSPKYGPVVAFINHDLNVWLDDKEAPDPGPARDKCLIHNANDPDQLQGCVAVGVSVVHFDHPHHEDSNAPQGWGVNHSRRTLERLRARWKDRKNLTATIKWSDAMRPAQ